jgi:hypothetical protein
LCSKSGTLIVNMPSQCVDKALKLNEKWYPFIGSFQININHNKWWFQIHNKKFETHYHIFELSTLIFENSMHLNVWHWPIHTLLGSNDVKLS